MQSITLSPNTSPAMKKVEKRVQELLDDLEHKAWGEIKTEADANMAGDLTGAYTRGYKQAVQDFYKVEEKHLAAYGGDFRSYTHRGHVFYVVHILEFLKGKSVEFETFRDEAFSLFNGSDSEHTSYMLEDVSNYLEEYLQEQDLVEGKVYTVNAEYWDWHHVSSYDGEYDGDSHLRNFVVRPITDEKLENLVQEKQENEWFSDLKNTMYRMTKDGLVKDDFTIISDIMEMVYDSRESLTEVHRMLKMAKDFRFKSKQFVHNLSEAILKTKANHHD